MVTKTVDTLYHVVLYLYMGKNIIRSYFIMSTLKTSVKSRIIAAAACIALGAGASGYFAVGIGGDQVNIGETNTSFTAQASKESSAEKTQQEKTVTYSMWQPKLAAAPASAQTKTVTQQTTKQTTTTSATTKAAATTTKAVTTKKAVTTTKKVTAAKPVTTTKIQGNPVIYDVGGSVKERLNSVKPEELKPTITVSGNEKAVLEKYMKALVNDKMTNYEKVLTCYDYLINHTYYAYGGWNNPMQSVLVRGFGTCTEYSHVMCAMLRYMGFKANTVWGQTTLAGGGYGQHMWVELTINGNTYVVDPQVDDNMSYGGRLSHKRFVKLYSEVPGQYIRGYTEKW